MANKKKVTAKRTEKESVLLTSLPQNIMKMGGHVEADKNIYISQSAYKAIHNFTKDKLENESGGMLMGYTLEGAGKTNIIVDGFIEAKHSEATPTTLTFTHETWDYVHAEAEKHYPDHKIIGWIHTHPSFGIFLSEYDKFIQQNFFDGENQIAYVVDPIQKTEGFYFWINEKIEKCNGFYIYDKTGTPILIEKDQSDKKNETASAVTEKRTGKDFLLIFMSILTMVLLFATISLNGKVSELEKDTNRLLNEQKSSGTYIASLLTEIGSLKQKVTNLQEKVEDSQYMCKIIFKNPDGSLISQAEYEFGAEIVPPSNPTMKSNNTYNYVFVGWETTPNLALGNTVFIAKYTSVLREYTIKFVDVDGNIIAETKHHYGDTVVIPDYAPTKESEDPNFYNYAFRWDKEVTSVIGNTTYKATFVKDYIEYTVRFIRDDGSLIEEKTYHYNDVINMANPTKASTETHSYTFKEWDKAFAPVTENTEYKAIFEATPIPPANEGDGE